MDMFSRKNLILTASRIAIVAASGILSGCSGANLFSGNENSATRNLVLPEQQDVVGGAAYWGARVEANREDIPAAVSFAKSLRKMGGAQQAVTLLKDIVVKAPDNASVLSEYGKALAAVGRSSDAIPFLSRSIQIDGRDWATISAYAVALDQTGSHSSAQDNYRLALELSPDNPSVQSNLAMSYVLSGQISQGEAILRKLVARPDATAQMRQNLAMVVTIKGNKAEAEQLARQDLTPAETQNNMAVLRQMSVSTPKPSAPAVAPAPATTPAAVAPNSNPLLVKPVNTSVLPPPARPMAPIADEPETPRGATEQDGAPKNIIVPASNAVKASSVTPARTPVRMAPIADDEDQPKTAQPAVKPATATKPDQAAAPATLRQSLNIETLEEAPLELATIVNH